MITLAPASDKSGHDAFALLVKDYAAWLSQRLANEAWFIEAVLKHQSLDADLAAIETAYGPHEGLILLASQDGEAAGGVAFRKLEDDICEMKRMFIRQRFRGQGLGRKLCVAIMEEARGQGYRLMRLDTSPRLTEAIALYESLSFRVCPPYRNYPAEFLPHMLFMELELAPQ